MKERDVSARYSQEQEGRDEMNNQIRLVLKEEQVSTKKSTILVADDYPAMQKLLSRALRTEGYQVVTATDGDTALRLAVTTKPLVLVILEMEVTEESIEICCCLREFSDVPVIILAAKYEERDLVRSLEDGADDFIVKPFDVTELTARVKVVLRRSGYQSR